MSNNLILYGKDKATGAITTLQGYNNVLLTTSAQIAGVIQMYAGSSAPSNWLMCDGSAISRSTYSALFSVIGTTYGIGDGSTTFNIPNLQNKMPIGKGTGNFDNLNNTGGAETIALTTNELPAHNHFMLNNEYRTSNYDDIPVSTVNKTTGVYGGCDPGNTDRHRMALGASVIDTGITSTTGTGTAFNKMPPYIVINFIISTGN